MLKKAAFHKISTNEKRVANKKMIIFVGLELNFFLKRTSTASLFFLFFDLLPVKLYFSDYKNVEPLISTRHAIKI